MAATGILPYASTVFKSTISHDEDFLNVTLGQLLQQLINEEVSARIGAMPHERTESRNNSRNGVREIDVATRVGHIPLEIPKLRKGSYYPSFLEPRRLWEKALTSVVQEAYVHGISTRKMDDLVKALGLEGIDRSAVSRLTKGLDEAVDKFRNRSLDGRYPYIWLDATYPKARNDGRVVGMASVIAIGVNEKGERTVLGFDAGLSEDTAFWKSFLGNLVSRGAKDVRMVVSDAHDGLKRAIGEVFPGASWQRCRVHFMRNILCHIPRAAQPMVAALVKTVYAQPDQESALKQAKTVMDQLEQRFPKAMGVFEVGVMDSLAYMPFPKEQWTQLHSTNVLERLNREIKRRTNVVSIFPNREALIRLVGAILMEQDDEWACAEKKYFSLAGIRKIPGYENLGEMTIFC